MKKYYLILLVSTVIVSAPVLPTHKDASDALKHRIELTEEEKEVRNLIILSVTKNCPSKSFNLYAKGTALLIHGCGTDSLKPDHDNYDTQEYPDCKRTFNQLLQTKRKLETIEQESADFLYSLKQGNNRKD
jgi:hypothetical protein